MKRWHVVLIILLIIAAAAGAWFIFGRGAASPAAQSGDASDAGQPPYVFDDAGLYFTYPRAYDLESYPLSDDSGNSWISLMLVRTADKAAAESNGASEGPLAITVGIIPNDTNAALEDWIKDDSRSNFTESADQALTPAQVGGESALSYSYNDGIFTHDATAVAHNGSIYIIDVDYSSASDNIRSDYQNLLKTVQFK